jgi:ornithine carbamoyltransferase
MLKLFQATSNKTMISIRNHISYSGNPDQYISRHHESISDVMKALDSMVDLASIADQDARQLERLIKKLYHILLTLSIVILCLKA